MKKLYISPLRVKLIVTRLALSGIALATFAVVSCTSKAPKREVPPGPRVSIMTYNVENLFDTQHDEGKDDYTFLPLAAKKDPKVIAACEKNTNDYYRKECLTNDWNDKTLQIKLDRVADVIKQVGDGRGPDIQILAEVENKNVLEMLRTQRLQKSDYQTSVLLEGPDERGIDPAVLSRFPQWDQPKLHIIPLKAETPEGKYASEHTRGILEVRLLLPDGQKVSVFALHFPSQGNPSYLRKQAADYLNQLQKSLPADVLPIVGGDFNISREEDQTKGYFSTILASQWLITHKIGCKECEGTHYFHPKTDWSFLDALLFAPSMQGSGAAAWKVDPESIYVPHASDYQVNKYGNPARFNEESAVGVSDHWPMYAEIYKPSPVKP